MIDLEQFTASQTPKRYEPASNKVFSPHFEYALFSLNKNMFGWVGYNWFQCNHPLDPVEYDADIEKGFKVMTEGDEEAYECDSDPIYSDNDFMKNIIKVPVGFKLYRYY